MARCNTNSLLSSAACFSCVPKGFLLPLKLALLSQILVAKGGTLPDVNTLLARANCFACIPQGQLDLIRIQLLCQILGGNVFYSYPGPNPGSTVATQDITIT